MNNLHVLRYYRKLLWWIMLNTCAHRGWSGDKRREEKKGSNIDISEGLLVHSVDKVTQKGYEQWNQEQLQIENKSVRKVHLSCDHHSLLGMHPWVFKHTSQFQLTCPWAFPRNINCIYLYGRCYINPLRFGTWMLIHEWTLVQGTSRIYDVLQRISTKILVCIYVK